jgi:transposase
VRQRAQTSSLFEILEIVHEEKAGLAAPEIVICEALRVGLGSRTSCLRTAAQTPQRLGAGSHVASFQTRERNTARGKFWAGLDLGLRQTHVCIVDDAGKPKHEVACETTVDAITGALSVVPKERIGLVAVEAGCDTYAVRLIKEAHYPVALFEARKASKFLSVRRSKTDASDARGLADLARIGRHTVSQVHLKSLDCEQLRARLTMRHRLVKMRVAGDLALRARLAHFGEHVKMQYQPERLREEIASHLEKLKISSGVDLESELAPLIDVCLSLRKYVRSLDRALEREAKQHPVCARLMSVSGVGPICALSFFSAVEDPARFKSAEDVAAYLGLVPRRYQSGETSYTKGITKTGNKMTRTHLVGAALVFGTRGPDSALKQWASDLRGRIGASRARVALARKLSIVLLAMWKSGSKFDPYPVRSPLPGNAPTKMDGAGWTELPQDEARLLGQRSPQPVSRTSRVSSRLMKNARAHKRELIDDFLSAPGVSGHGKGSEPLMAKKRTHNSGEVGVNEHEGAVLGLIARHQPVTRYQLFKAFKELPTTSFNASKGSLYPLVGRMVDRGFVQEAGAKGPRQGEVLKITRLGKQALTGWVVQTGPEQSFTRDPLLLRMMSLNELKPSEQVRWIADAKEAILEKKRELNAHGQSANGPYMDIVQGIALSMIKVKLEWLDRLLIQVVNEAGTRRPLPDTVGACFSQQKGSERA